MQDIAMADDENRMTVKSIKWLDDGSAVVNGKRFWADYFAARRHKTPERGSWAMRWVVGPDKFTTLYC